MNTVAELIAVLRQCPQDMRHVFNSSEDPNFFILTPIENIDIIESPDVETVVLIHNEELECDGDDEEDLSYLN